MFTPIICRSVHILHLHAMHILPARLKCIRSAPKQQQVSVLLLSSSCSSFLSPFLTSNMYINILPDRWAWDVVLNVRKFMHKGLGFDRFSLQQTDSFSLFSQLCPEFRSCQLNQCLRPAAVCQCLQVDAAVFGNYILNLRTRSCNICKLRKTRHNLACQTLALIDEG